MYLFFCILEWPLLSWELQPFLIDLCKKMWSVLQNSGNCYYFCFLFFKFGCMRKPLFFKIKSCRRLHHYKGDQNIRKVIRKANNWNAQSSDSKGITTSLSVVNWAIVINRKSSIIHMSQKDTLLKVFCLLYTYTLCIFTQYTIVISILWKGLYVAFIGNKNMITR